MGSFFSVSHMLEHLIYEMTCTNDNAIRVTVITIGDKDRRSCAKVNLDEYIFCTIDSSYQNHPHQN